MGAEEALSSALETVEEPARLPWVAELFDRLDRLQAQLDRIETGQQETNEFVEALKPLLGQFAGMAEKFSQGGFGAIAGLFGRTQ